MRALHKLLLLSAALPILHAAAPDYLPLTPGNRWVYRDSVSGQNFTITVQIPDIHNGNAYYKVTGYTADPAYLRRADNGNIYRWDNELERESIVTSFEIVPGGYFDTEIGGCPQSGQRQPEVVPYAPPNFAPLSAIQIKYRSYACADAGLLEEQYAENLGLLRRVVTTITGPRTYDLVYAKTAALTFDTGRGTTFSVTLDQNYLVCGIPGADQLNVDMRLTRRQAPSMDLVFPTAQRYDIRILDEAGVVVYQWSDHQVVAQAEGSVVLNQDLEYNQMVPLRKANGQTLDGGYYTVEAWLTTPGREFAAATRFFYSPCESVATRTLRLPRRF